MASKLDYYETYFKNLSPTTFDVRQENNEIIISNICQPYPRGFKPSDVKQYPVMKTKYSGCSNEEDYTKSITMALAAVGLYFIVQKIFI